MSRSNGKRIGFNWAALLLALVALAALPSTAWATDSTWEPTANGQTVNGVTWPSNRYWSQEEVWGTIGGQPVELEPSNWTTATYPNNGHGAASYDVSIGLGGADTTMLDASVAINVLTLTPTGALAIGNGNRLTIAGGSLGNSGLISLQSTGALTDLVASHDLLISGSGTIQLGNNGQNRIFGQDTNLQTISIGAGQTIAGSGRVGVNRTAIINDGSIIANQGVALTLDPGAGGLTNHGTLKATNGAVLYLSQGAFTNDGLIRAEDGSQVQLYQPTVSGGTLDSLGSGCFHDIFNATLSGVTLESSLAVDNNASLSLAGPSGTYNGTIALNATDSQTNLILTNGQTLNGTGKIAMSNNSLNRIYARDLNAQTLTVGPSFTIQGSGQLGVSRTIIVNHGTIAANQPVPLDVSSSAGGVTNAGTLKATNGAVLYLSHGTFTNTGGTIRAEGGSEVQFESPTLIGGTLAASGSGLLRNVAAATLEGVTLDTDTLLAVDNNTSLSLAGPSGTYNGTIALNSTGTLTNVILISDQTLNGTGKIVLSNNGLNRIYGRDLNVQTLTVGPSFTIQGSGQLGVSRTAIVNHGAIAAAPGASLDILTSGIGFSTDGLLSVAAGGTANVNKFLQTGGDTSVDGTLNAVSGALLDFQGGVLAGPGPVNGTARFGNSGALSPGHGIGTMHLTSSVSYVSGGQFIVQLGTGTASDLAAIDGALDLAGANDSLLLSQFPGTTFGGPYIIATASTISGTFNSVTPGYTVDYSTPGKIIITAGPASLYPGDANGDGKVSVGDLGVLAGDYGNQMDMTWSQGDFTGDGKVTVGDLGILAYNYGYGGPAAPEPATLTLLAAGLACLRQGRARRG